MPSSTSILTIVGVCLLLHSAYSCQQYRSILSAFPVDLPASYDPAKPPLDVVIECIVGFVFCLLAKVLETGPYLVVISGTGEKGRSAPLYETRDFDSFNTRVRILAKSK
mmetsp:Transcript_17958/g.17312  ORF Transcript_17958/g.17312 Transcript_17958/m.17312 type:complete len:109 (-) Transcript_17958:346-672(-)